MRSDSEIEQQVLRSLKLTLAMAATEICVESNEGVVTLKGTAPSHRTISAIRSAACQAPGVRDVVNEVHVKGRRSPISESQDTSRFKSRPYYPGPASSR